MSDDSRNPLSLPPMSRRMQFFAIAIFFAVGLALGAFILGNPLGLPFLPHAAPGEAQPAAAGPSVLYQCPMHPDVIEPNPANCPICGMPLVAMDTPADEATGVIEIDPVQVQNTGVVSVAARLGETSRTVRTVGILDFNADRITWINMKYQGWIEKVHVSYVGQQVAKGDPLFEIYSPELVTTQEEYLRAIEYWDSLVGSERTEARRQALSLLRSSRDRLHYWDISDDQIRTLEQSKAVQRRLTVSSPVDGVVAEVMNESLEGMFVSAGMNLYRIADMGTLWVHADVYESDLPWVRENQPAEVTFRFDPDRVLRGKVLFLYPEVSQETRTLKICIEIPNSGGQLRAGMFSDVVIKGPPIPDSVLIPYSAVLRSGERNLVFLDLGDGKFEAREVKLGIAGDDEVQVLEGVMPGQAVVTQAQFMLDSESRVQEAIAKLGARGTVAPKSEP